MAFITYVSLNDKYDYFCNITVNGINMLLTVSYNTRVSKRVIQLTSEDGSISYLKPTFISYGDRVYLNNNMLLEGYSVYISLDKISSTASSDYINWSKEYRLAFVNME